MLNFTGRTIWCNLFWASKLTSNGKKRDPVIFTLCWEGNKYDKNNLDLFSWAIHLKPPNIYYISTVWWVSVMQELKDSQHIRLYILVFYVQQTYLQYKNYYCLLKEDLTNNSTWRVYVPKCFYFNLYFLDVSCEPWIFPYLGRDLLGRPSQLYIEEACSVECIEHYEEAKNITKFTKEIINHVVNTISIKSTF